MRAARPFRQTDVLTALKAAQKAGLSVDRAEIGQDGKIVIVFKDPAAPPQVTPLEAWRQKRGGQSAA